MASKFPISNSPSERKQKAPLMREGLVSLIASFRNGNIRDREVFENILLSHSHRFPELKLIA
jgi:hypothetical protein